MSWYAFIGALEQGFVYGIMVLGVYLTFRVLDFPDLTVDGSLPLGASVSAVAITHGVNPFVSLGLAAAAGFAAGTVTALASEGDVLVHGDTLFVVEGDPVTLFVSDVPFYRTLTVGTVGDDVRVLEESLVTFGFDAGGALIADGEFDDATQDAVFAWQESIGAPVDGVVNIGEIVVTDDPIRIATAHIGIGSNVAPGTTLFTPSTSTSATMAARAS